MNISTCSNRDKKQKQKQKQKKKEKNDRLTQNFEVCYTSKRIFSGLKRGS